LRLGRPVNPDNVAAGVVSLLARSPTPWLLGGFRDGVWRDGPGLVAEREVQEEELPFYSAEGWRL